MKKIISLYILFVLTGQLCTAQTDNTQNEIEIYKALAKQKAARLQIELSLTDEQTERIIKKIFKYSITAKDVLQSSLDIDEKTKKLYNIAAKQKEEIRTILSESQYAYYKRRSSPTPY